MNKDAQELYGYVQSKEPDCRVTTNNADLVSFQHGSRQAVITFDRDGAVIAYFEGAEKMHFKQPYTTIGPTLVQRLYASVLWVMGY